MGEGARGRLLSLRNDAVSAAALATLWLAMLIGGTGPLDQTVYRALYAGGHPDLVRAARIVTFLGVSDFLVPAAIIVAAILAWRGRVRTGLGLFAMSMLGRFASDIQKVLTDRNRPDLEPHLVLVQSQSFPSGHAVSSMIFYLAVALLLTDGSRWRRPAVFAALALSGIIGITRVMLGVHWPSDVVGGWAFGLLWVLVTLPLVERLGERDLRR